jgi:hypothetical protein
MEAITVVIAEACLRAEPIRGVCAGATTLSATGSILCVTGWFI